MDSVTMDVSLLHSSFLLFVLVYSSFSIVVRMFSAIAIDVPVSTSYTARHTLQASSFNLRLYGSGSLSHSLRRPYAHPDL